MPMPCKYCKVDTHSSFTCFKRPRKTLQAKRRIKKVGKLGKAYMMLRQEYFKDHPGDEHYCYYCLYIGIEIPLDKRQTQVEHYYSKARHPDKRFDKTNLVASCSFHNKLKGSTDGPEFLEILKEN